MVNRTGPRIDKSKLVHGVQCVIEAPDYLAWLRKLACAACYAQPVDAAHLRLKRGPGTGAGLSQKNDRYAMPLCRSCHAYQHQVGERKFWAGSEPHAMADRYWLLWPGRLKWETEHG